MNQPMNQTTYYTEPPLTTHLFAKAVKAGIPLSGTFELSPVCNFDCRMCYIRKTPAQVRASRRPIVTKDRWLELAEQAKEAGMLYLLLTGGEPLLWPDFWELYEKLVKMGLLVSINTNGSLIDEEAVKRFQKLPPNRINISLYGATDEVYRVLCGADGVFSRVDRAIRALTQAGLPVKLNGSLTPENIGDLPFCLDYAKQQGLVYAANTYMFPPVRKDPDAVGQNRRFTPEEAAKYRLEVDKLQRGEAAYQSYLQSIAAKAAKQSADTKQEPDCSMQCRAGKAAFWITWDGLMTPCGMMPAPAVDIAGQSFWDVWQQLREKTGQLRVSSQCAGCSRKHLCHSCAAMALAETGDVAQTPGYLCRMAAAMEQTACGSLKNHF